jgi:hypothetical protein
MNSKDIILFYLPVKMAELDNPEVQPEEDYNLVKQARII